MMSSCSRDAVQTATSILSTPPSSRPLRPPSCMRAIAESLSFRRNLKCSTVNAESGSKPTSPTSTRSLPAPFPERELFESPRRLHDVEIALGIDSNVMTCSEDACWLGTADNLQRLAIENENLVAATNIEELLIGIRRQCEIAGKGYVSPDDLLYELALFRKHLNATVFTIGHINGSVLRHADRVYDAELIGTRIRKSLWRHDLTMVIIDRFVPKGSPHSLEGAAVRIENDDTMVAVTIGHEQLVGLIQERHIRRTVNSSCVRITLVLIAVADLHHELTVLCELQDLIVGHSLQARQPVSRTIISADPDEAFVVDMDSVLAFGPFIAVTGAAPGLDIGSCCIEHDHRRRGLRFILGLERSRPVQDPDIVLGIDRGARSITEFPLRLHFGPRAIDFKRSHTTALRLHSLSR